MNILIVDDNQINLVLLAALVRKLGQVMPIEYSDPVQALAWAAENNVDLVLVDYMMPEIDGLQFISQFRAIPGMEHVPIIMITADADSDVRYQALDLGANDFLTKPIDGLEFTARVRNLTALRKSQQELANHAASLSTEVKKATEELHAREREVIFRLSRAAEFRDPETGYHLQRMAHYCRHIARNLGLPEDEQELLLEAAPMHDVGKVGIPDQVLLKAGKLDEEEYAIMKQHALMGASILKNSTSLLLQTASMIALTHHEKYDGSGYPQGLKGDSIPLYGRITAVADVFDALTSPRPYKTAWSIEQARDFVKNAAGSHFDPRCVEAFLQNWEDVLAIQQTYQDTN